jgi:hypothetical protein
MSVCGQDCMAGEWAVHAYSHTYERAGRQDGVHWRHNRGTKPESIMSTQHRVYHRCKQCHMGGSATVRAHPCMPAPLVYSAYSHIRSDYPCLCSKETKHTQARMTIPVDESDTSDITVYFDQVRPSGSACVCSTYMCR